MRTREHQENLFVCDKSEQNISKELDCIDWFNIDGYNDPLERYTKAYETHFPLEKLKQRLHFRKLWISQDLLKSVKQKNKLYKQCLPNPSLWNEVKYKAYKNKLNHSLRIAKHLYYDKNLSESKSNMIAT